MNLEVRKAWSCYSCDAKGRQQSNRVPVANLFTESGIPLIYRYMCADCLFDAVRDKVLKLHYTPADLTIVGFSDIKENSEWACYGPCRVDTPRVGEINGTDISPIELEYLCPQCLFDRVVDGTFVVSVIVKKEAAPTGPTANVDKETGAVSVDGITFRW